MKKCRGHHRRVEPAITVFSAMKIRGTQSEFFDESTSVFGHAVEPCGSALTDEYSSQNGEIVV